MRLVVIEVPGLPAGATQAQEYDFQSDPYRSVWVVGRQLGSNIHLVDPSVSRSHAEITVGPQGLWVRDLGSSNGTFVNDQPVSAEQPASLKAGDRLRIGNVVTLLEGGALASNFEDEQTFREPPALVARQSPRSQLPPTASLHEDAPPRSGPPVFKPEAPRPAPMPMMAQPAPVQQIAVPPRPVEDNTPVRSRQDVPSFAPPQPNYNGSVSRQSEPSAGYAPLPPQSYAPPQPAYEQAQYAPRLPQSPALDAIRPAKPGRSPAREIKAAQKPRRRSLWPLWVLVGLVVLAGAVGAVYFLVLAAPASSNSSATVSLPSNVFSSPANSDTVLGLNVAHPSAWKRSDAGANQVLFYQPDNTTIVLNIEKPPSRTILDASLPPEGALRQYVANVKANSTKFSLPTDVGQVKFKDGTAGAITRLIFTTSSSPAVTDYTMTAASLKCGNQLYFVSAAAQAKDSNPAVRQDLDAAIANLTCAN